MDIFLERHKEAILGVVEGFDERLVQETRDRATEHVAGELHRQIGFF